MEHQSEVLVGTGERDLLFSGEQSIGSQYEIASPSRFDNDFEMTATAPTPARNHKRLQLSRLAIYVVLYGADHTLLCVCNSGVTECFVRFQ